MRLALLANVNVNSLARRLRRTHDVYVAAGFGSWVQELVSADSPMRLFAPEVIILLLDGSALLKGIDPCDWEYARRELDEAVCWIESSASTLDKCALCVSTLDIEQTRITSLKSERIERKAEHHWFDALNRLSNQFPNFFQFDLKQIIENHGRRRFYDRKLWYAGGLRFGAEAEQVIARDIERLLACVAGARKKCLVLDLDNTLWGGVVGEDGIDGIQLGDSGAAQRYKDFQCKIKDMQRIGVMLAVVSKNNWADAIEVFEKHPHMVLKQSDFVAMKIEWRSKAQCIAEIADSLNIGLDSFVFVDDSAVERESVRSALPDVVIPEFPEDTSLLSDFIGEIARDHFMIRKTTEEDLKKTRLYREESQRAASAKFAGSLEDFLHSLQTEIRIWRATDKDTARAAQLTQKTNQFNFTTRRYSEEQMKQLIASPEHFVFIASVSDRFGDSGKTLLSVIKAIDQHQAQLDTFLMSCRVMGRHIEDQVFDHICNDLHRLGYRRMIVELVRTKKNAPTLEFASRLDWQQEKEDSDRSVCSVDLSCSKVRCPPYAKLLSLP
jgi:FkbH-like protein